MSPVTSITWASASTSGPTAAIVSPAIRTSPLGRSPSSGSTVSTCPPRSSSRSPMASPFGREQPECAVNRENTCVRFCFPGSLLPDAVRLRLAQGRQRRVHCPVAVPGDQHVLGREPGDDLAAVVGYAALLLDPRGRRAVRRRPVGLQRENHAWLDALGVLERHQPAEDRLLPDGQADAVAVLQGEGGLLAREAELGGPWPDRHDVGGGAARLDEGD